MIRRRKRRTPEQIIRELPEADSCCYLSDYDTKPSHVDTPARLVVDDEGGICRARRRILEPAGFRVRRDARIGLVRAIAADFSAILLDVRMPETGGSQLVEQLRREKQNVPVVIMTG